MQQLNQFGHACGMCADFDQWALFGQLHKHRRQDADDKGFACADPQPAGDLGWAARDILRPPHCTKNVQRVRQKPFTCFCQLDAPADPFKQLHMQFPFQLLDLHGHSRLRVSKLLCRAGEVLRFCDPDKGNQVSDFHSITIKKIEYIY